MSMLSRIPPRCTCSSPSEEGQPKRKSRARQPVTSEPQPGQKCGRDRGYETFMTKKLIENLVQDSVAVLWGIDYNNY